jgi:hypothetical protein
LSNPLFARSRTRTGDISSKIKKGDVMGAPPEVRIPIENQRMMQLYQPALGQSLDSIEDGETILLHGFAHVGNCSGYYLITDRGVHYCDSQKTGLFKKTYVSQFFPRARMARAIIDQVAGPQNAYLRIYDKENKMALVIWFDEEPWQKEPCGVQAEAAASALGFT